MKEPQELQQETVRIQQQLSNLAYSEYKSFLRAHESWRELQSQMKNMESNLTDLDSGFDRLQSKIDKMLQGSHKYTEERENIERLVLKQEQILELLEIPQAYFSVF
jgi:uncharacterized phage infection (PIP) family protein YhgE